MIARGITSTPHMEVVDHTCTDASKLIKQSDASVRSVLKKLQEVQDDPAELKERETNLGWSLNKYGLLLNAALQGHAHPYEQIFYDWMHTFFQGGIFNKHAIVLLKALRTLSIMPSTVYEYVT